MSDRENMNFHVYQKQEGGVLAHRVLPALCQHDYYVRILRMPASAAAVSTQTKSERPVCLGPIHTERNA